MKIFIIFALIFSTHAAHSKSCEGVEFRSLIGCISGQEGSMALSDESQNVTLSYVQKDGKKKEVGGHGYIVGDFVKDGKTQMFSSSMVDNKEVFYFRTYGDKISFMYFYVAQRGEPARNPVQRYPEGWDLALSLENDATVTISGDKVQVESERISAAYRITLKGIQIEYFKEK